MNENRRQNLNTNICGIQITLYVPCTNDILFNIIIVVYNLSDGNIIHFSVQHLIIEPLSSLTHGPIYLNCK